MLYKACRFVALRFSEISARQAQGIRPASFGKAIRKRTRHAHSADRRRRIIGTSVGRVTSGLAWPSQDNASDRLQANHMTGVTKTFASSSFKRATAVRELTCYITQAAQQLLQWLLLYCIWTCEQTLVARFVPHMERHPEQASELKIREQAVVLSLQIRKQVTMCSCPPMRFSVQAVVLLYCDDVFILVVAFRHLVQYLLSISKINQVLPRSNAYTPEDAQGKTEHL